MQPRLAAADSPKERPAACTHRRNLRPPDDRRRRNSAHLYARDLRARTVIGPTGEVEGGHRWRKPSAPARPPLYMKAAAPAAR